MEIIKLAMVLDNLDNIENYKLADDFSFVYFNDNDEQIWANIEYLADEFESEEAALERFNNEFKGLKEDLYKRNIFIENKDGQKIATIMAWYGDLRGFIEGRIHWVSIIPEYQGKSLAKPLLAKALKVLAKYHKSVYLTTQTRNYKAINLYLSFGFKPYINYDNDLLGWKLVEEKLNKKIL